MAYTFKQKLLDNSRHSIKCPGAMIPIGVCIHNTANDATAVNEITYMGGNDAKVSFHVAVDDKEVIQAVPFNLHCWASGDGSGDGNKKHIHIEICYSKSGGDRFTEAEKNAASYTATLLKEYGWDVSKVKRHKDFSNKDCPHRTMALGWQRFVDMVQSELNKLNGSSGEITNPPEDDKPFKVGEYNGLVRTTSDLNVRSARNATSIVITVLPKGTQITVGYIMYEDNKTTGTNLWGGVMVSGKQGFIHLGYVKPVITIQYYPPPTITMLFIAALDAMKIDSSLENCKKIANVNNISNYTGTDEQNAQMFDLLKQGTLIKG